MKIEFDKSKSERNIKERGLAFDAVIDMDWQTAVYDEDVRKVYPERRFIASGYVGFRLHIVCFAHIEDGIRIISFRKANKREVKKYEETIIKNQNINDQIWQG